MIDPDGTVSQAYQQLMAFPSAAYPQDWVIGKDGRVIYMNNHFQLDAMVAAIESQL